ncbi:MAG: hypothetical protein U0457_17525 [Candidatus Sericytochromatia bacterium]
MAKIKCKECRSVAEETETYCPECGAIFVKPFVYVDDEIKAAVAAAPKAKSFEEMSKDEKIHQLGEKCHDIRDELVKLKHEITEKANECMRCFTAAGIARARDFDDDIENLLYKRKENFADFDVLVMEYRKILAKVEEKVNLLNQAKEDLEKFKKS